MPPEIVEAIGPVIVTLSLGAFILIGMKMRYQHKAKQLEHEKPVQELERLGEALDGLYERTSALHEEVVELQERLDFHERLLTESKEEMDKDSRGNRSP
jgi:hypothetical protein